MAHENKVLRSINADDREALCVDIFRRPDGSYGFEEFRREPEDGRGWYPIGFHAERRFETEAEAMAAACTSVSWLRMVE